MNRSNYFVALSICVTTAVQAGPVVSAADYADDELYPVAIVVDGNHRYELTELACAKEERLQRVADTASGQAYGRWLTQHVKAHPSTKSFTRYAGSAFDGGGCYEPTTKGIRTYRPNSTPADVDEPVLPCTARLTQSGTCAQSKSVPSQKPAARWTPDPAMSKKLIGTLMTKPYARSAEPFLFEDQPAVLWTVACKLVAQMQMSEMEGVDYPFLQWQASQQGNLITVQRIDGTYSEGCYERTPDGIRVRSFGNADPMDMRWKTPR